MKLAIVLALALAACSAPPEYVSPEQPAEQAQSLDWQPAPTPGCPWTYAPLWRLEITGCSAVHALEGTGQAVAPLAAGSDGRCLLEQFQGKTWAAESSKDVVLWRRAGETQPPQYGWHECVEGELYCSPMRPVENCL